MNGSTGSGGGKKLRAGHVIRVNNKTKQVTFSDLVLISHSQADNLIREKWPLK